MKSVFNYIVAPKHGRSTSTKEIDGKELILNTELQNHNYTSRLGVVRATPLAIDTDIQPGDEFEGTLQCELVIGACTVRRPERDGLFGRVDVLRQLEQPFVRTQGLPDRCRSLAKGLVRLVELALGPRLEALAGVVPLDEILHAFLWGRVSPV